MLIENMQICNMRVFALISKRLNNQNIWNLMSLCWHRKVCGLMKHCGDVCVCKIVISMEYVQ